MPPDVGLKDVPSNPTFAEVDDVRLRKGGDPVALKQDQIDRLKKTGAKLVIGGQDEVDDEDQSGDEDQTEDDNQLGQPGSTL